MAEKKPETKKVGKWYFGGIAGSAGVCCTHPLDLIKVHMQTQHTTGKKVGIAQLGVRIFRTDGILGFYNGLSAAVLRQMTYTLTRFGIFEITKNNLESKKMRPITFYESALLSGFSGFIAGIVGTPADLVNVRMQNDMKLLVEHRRNYKHVFDGLIRMVRTEGTSSIMNGVTMASTRAVLMNIGQISFYGQFKVMLLSTGKFHDNIKTHFLASCLAGGTSTLLTMPMDVMKTRMMNAPPGKYPNILACARDIGSEGASSFFKGFIPAFVRLAPLTILTFIFYEQLRLRFGDEVQLHDLKINATTCTKK